MQTSIALNVSAMLSEDGFSLLDELLVRTKELFDREGIAGFVALLLDLVDARLCERLIHHGRSGWQAKPCCSQPDYVLQSRLQRRIRTSIGVVRLTWRRLRCRGCGRSILPLREFLDLRRYQSKSSELEQLVIEVVSEQNYRRAVRHWATIGMIPVPRSTAHRWVALSDCAELSPAESQLPVLLSDGTGYKRRPDPSSGTDNRGEVRVALGITDRGIAVPLGAWTDKSWNEIGQALGTSDSEQGAPHQVLVSDGESGLAAGLAHLVNHHQRCHWHQLHDLYFQLYRDRTGIADSRAYRQELAGIIGIELPAADFRVVAETDKAALAQTVASAEQKVRELVDRLVARGYHKAATYIRNALEDLFTYIRVWLKYGLVVPRVTSRLERMMREIGRRLKRIAFGWSERGAARMTRIIIKRFTSAGQWQAYWAKRLRITGRVSLTLTGISAS